MAEINNGYTQAQIASMQQDAMRRVNEMQRISQERLNGTQPNRPAAYTPKTQQDNRQKNNAEQSIKQEQPITLKQAAFPIQHMEAEVVSSGFKGILEKLDLNEEKIIIMLLLLLLVNEGADIKLILALVYILL